MITDHVALTSPDATRRRERRRIAATIGVTTVGLLVFAGCSTGADTSPQGVADDVELASSTAETTSTASDVEQATDELDLFDSTAVHTIDVEFDQADYDAMIDTFTETGDKEWISATVTLDGSTYDNVGVRLKGNSSLFGLSADTASNPQELPWLIRLNKFVDGEDHQGYEEIVIRSNSTETGLNEAVAQELLSIAGLASQRPIATAFIVNDSDTQLRLAVEHPDEEWYDDNFSDENGLLYKADSGGDYSYRGDAADAYTDVFDQKVGDDDLEPLIEFLDFINNSDDATFAAELDERLDVDSFASYLAFQDLIGNHDDIDGAGNNSYLQFDTVTERFTVVSWDLNLAFGTANVGGGPAGGPGRPPGEDVPGAGADRVAPTGAGNRPPGGPFDNGDAPILNGVPDGATGPLPGGGTDGPGIPGGQHNVLVERFLADDEFAELYDTKTVELNELLVASGTVDEVIANWTDVLLRNASALVSESTVTDEASALVAFIDGQR